jgi:hypothetical protein
MKIVTQDADKEFIDKYIPGVYGSLRAAWVHGWNGSGKKFVKTSSGEKYRDMGAQAKYKEMRMKLTIKIDMDNAAFHEQPEQGAEVTRILTKLAGELEGYIFKELPQGGFLHDANGNFCGAWRVTGK